MLIQHKPDLARNTNTGFMYCNTNYALLALIVEKVTASFSFGDAENRFQTIRNGTYLYFSAKDSLRAAQSFYYQGSRLYPTDKLDGIYGDKTATPRQEIYLSFQKRCTPKIS